MPSVKHFFDPRPLDTPEITIRGVGVNETMPPAFIRRPRGKPDWMFMLFCDPVDLADDRGAVRPCPANTMIVRAPGQPQGYGAADRKWKHSWIHCDGRFVRRLMRQLQLPRSPPILHANPDAAEQHLLAIHDELTGQERPDPRIVCNLLENWLRRVRRRMDRSEAPSVVPRRFLDAKQYLDRHFAEPVRLRDLAGRLDMTEQHLCKCFSGYFGVSPKHYIIRLRIHYATQLLGDDSLSVTQVAEMAGYSDLYQFSRLFKKHTGVSPSAMRRSGGR